MKIETINGNVTTNNPCPCDVEAPSLGQSGDQPSGFHWCHELRHNWSHIWRGYLGHDTLEYITGEEYKRDQRGES